MKYSFYKLKFLTAVHIGAGALSRGKHTLYADTVFSALCKEALKFGKDKLDKLVEACRRNQIKLTDGLPFIEDIYYVPKPMLELDISVESDRTVKKAAKKLEYIPIEKMDDYLSGSLDVKEENEYFSNNIGRHNLVGKAKINIGEDANPYVVDTVVYGEKSGLYVCVGVDNGELEGLVKEIFTSLSYSGVGGKISAGYGKFELEIVPASDTFVKRLDNADYKKYMSLSISLPSDDELENVLKAADYLLIKRSGFVSSETYSETLRKKKDKYCMAAGFVFEKKFEGNILDVSNGGTHPVYRYAKPFIMGVK